jgi:TRAP-type C4-dicarboxylate transport system permease small subunit
MSGKKVQILEKAIKKTSSLLNNIGVALLFVMMTLGAADVVGRYFFKRSIVGSLELSSVMQGMMIFLGWGYTQMVRGNVNVDFVLNYFPPRVQAITNLATSFLSLVFFSLMAWQAVVIAKVYHEAGRLIFTINLPIAPFQLFVSLGAIMLSLSLIMDMIQYILQIKGAK